MDWLAIAAMLFVAALFVVFMVFAWRALREARRRDLESARHAGWLEGLDEGAATHEKLERARRWQKRARGD